jgi:hypothetical protein
MWCKGGKVLGQSSELEKTGLKTIDGKNQDIGPCPKPQSCLMLFANSGNVCLLLNPESFVFPSPI